MQLIQTEKYGTIDRDFEIYTFRDNNADELVLQTREVTGGKKEDIECSGRVPMNGDWNLEPKDYEGYSKQLSAVKSCIIIFTSIP